MNLIPRHHLMQFILLILLTQNVDFVTATEIPDVARSLHFNQIQYIGTHNSYHIAPGQAFGSLMIRANYQENPDWPAKRLVPALDYTHLPLQTQLALGIRSFELDIHYDPKGGKYANPGGLRLMQANLPLKVAYDPQGNLQKPGFKVFHAADIDVKSTCLRLIDCLKEIRQWSDANPEHFPIIIQFEAKEKTLPAIAGAYTPVQELKFTRTAWDALEAEMLSVFPWESIVTPGDVRGDHATLRQAIIADGWPVLAEMAGKVLFLLQDYSQENDVTKRYLDGAKNAQDRLLFVYAKPGHPDAGFIISSDPFDDDIPAQVNTGSIVMTKTDGHGIEARKNDVTRRDQAFESGAHFIQTDYPIPNRRFSNYQVRFSNEAYVRCNPVTFKNECPF